MTHSCEALEKCLAHRCPINISNYYFSLPELFLEIPYHFFSFLVLFLGCPPITSNSFALSVDMLLTLTTVGLQISLFYCYSYVLVANIYTALSSYMHAAVLKFLHPSFHFITTHLCNTGTSSYLLN